MSCFHHTARSGLFQW